MLAPTTVLALTSLLRVDALGESESPPPLDPFFALAVAKVRWHATTTASLVLRMHLTDLAWFINMTSARVLFIPLQ
ncbi:hypothetical protein A2U01_0028492 [Trifolium medium]|uniref:Secreted protein n=1 Tax=Trifolium medium TaxID=97028 RepID=A0A392P937_9FABA|nr:hypothetical protein [Trifolium medium]